MTDGVVAPVVLHSTWRGRVTSTLAPAVLLAIGVWGLSRGGVIIAGALAALGGVLFLIALFDYPWRTVIGPDGVERRCLLRTERLPWDRVTAIARPSSTKTVKRIAGSAGLVAEIGKRRYLLTNTCESTFEHDAIAAGMEVWDDVAVLRASRPGDEVAPTWLYQRRLDGGDGLVDAPTDLPRWDLRR